MIIRNILISGAGIAGLTLAYWLKQYGFNPTVVEKSSTLREGGYAIDFWGAGFEVAEKMQIIPQLEKADLGISKLLFVDKNNKRRSAMSYTKLKRLMNDRAFTLLRSDLAKAIYNQLGEGQEIIFGDSIKQINQREMDVEVMFHSSKVRSFDLVIGADGLHSNVREIAFGKEGPFEKYYGYYTASYIIDGGYLKNASFLTYNTPNKQASVYSIHGSQAAAFFIFRSPQKLPLKHDDVDAQKKVLRNEFNNAGWKCAELLSFMDEATDFYFDVVSQIQMERWSKNRITLVGDACDCPSLLSGQGSTLAMVGAYILAGELKEAMGDYIAAFKEYENIFKPFILRKQKVAQSFAKSFVPKTSFGIWSRNTFVRLMFLPLISNWFVKQYLEDNLKVKQYPPSQKLGQSALPESLPV